MNRSLKFSSKNAAELSGAAEEFCCLSLHCSQSLRICEQCRLTAFQLQIHAMKPTSILLLTVTILATTVPLHAQVQSPSPAATATPVAYEQLPTLDASVILQPQYFHGSMSISVKTWTKSFSSQIFSIKSWTEAAFFREIVDHLNSPLQIATHSLKRREFVGQQPEQSVRPTISIPIRRG